MLDLTNAKAQLIASTEPGTLVLYGVDATRYVGLCVSPNRDRDASRALVLFDYRDPDRRFSALYWARIDGQGCITLGAPRIAADPQILLTAPPAQDMNPGTLSVLPDGGFGITAYVEGSEATRTWNILTGELVETPDAPLGLSGWQIGVAGLDGNFTALVKAPMTSALG